MSEEPNATPDATLEAILALHAFTEGALQSLNLRMTTTQQSVIDVRHEMTRRLDRTEARMDERFDRVDKRFDRVEERLDRLEQTRR